GNLIAIPLSRVVAERVFAQQAIRHPYSDVCASGKLRQRLPLGMTKFEEMDAIGDSVIARHAQRHGQRLAGGVHDVSGNRATPNKWRLWRFEARASLARTASSNSRLCGNERMRSMCPAIPLIPRKRGSRFIFPNARDGSTSVNRS